MDAPNVSQLFKRLFRHPACPLRRNSAQLAASLRHARQLQRRGASTTRRGKKPAATNESDWQQRTDVFPLDMSDEYAKYPPGHGERSAVADRAAPEGQDAHARLRRGCVQSRPRDHRERRRLTFFLLVDKDSLYNPHYGYFSKQAVIFSPGQPFHFNGIRDEAEFQAMLSQRYTEFEDELDRAEPSDTRQLWYTPTELFRPYYGEAIARYLISNYMLHSYPYHDLVIFEMGAGRGTLMLNILDYIRAAEPEIYERTRFRVIEISSSLAALQQRQLLGSAAARGHAARVQIVNRSIFDWSELVPEPCFFLAFEVFDNFAHDALRYDLASETPLQGTVLISADGDFFEFYSPDLDPVAARFTALRRAATEGRHRLPYPSSRAVRYLQSCAPLAANLSPPEYIPTRLMEFFAVLDRFFPAHRLIASDFHSLPDAIRGLNAPVVQTRYQRRPVPVTTPLVGISPALPPRSPVPYTRGAT